MTSLASAFDQTLSQRNDTDDAPYWVIGIENSDIRLIVQAPDKAGARAEAEETVTAIAVGGTAEARTIAGCGCDPDDDDGTSGCAACDPAHHVWDDMKYAFDGCASPLELAAALQVAAHHYLALADQGWVFEEPVDHGDVQMFRDDKPTGR